MSLIDGKTTLKLRRPGRSDEVPAETFETAMELLFCMGRLVSSIRELMDDGCG